MPLKDPVDLAHDVLPIAPFEIPKIPDC